MPEPTPHSDYGHGEEGFRESSPMITEIRSPLTKHPRPRSEHF